MTSPSMDNYSFHKIQENKPPEAPFSLEKIQYSGPPSKYVNNSVHFEEY